MNAIGMGVTNGVTDDSSIQPKPTAAVSGGVGSLTGKRVAVTRAVHQSGSFEDLLRERGAVPLAYPCLSIQPVEDFGPLDAALRRAVNGHYSWLVITSVNTVNMLAARLNTLNLSAQALDLQIAAIGAKTARAVESWFSVRPQFVAEDSRSQGLAASLKVNAGTHVLLPQAEIAPTTLVDALSHSGIEVERIAVYRTISGGSGGVDLARLIQWKAVDAITFASPSAVRGFVSRMLDEAGQLPDLSNLVIGVVGPTTRQAALEAGLSVDVMPTVYTLEKLINAMEQYFAFH